MSFNISGVEIGHNRPCRFAVEVSNAHNGDLARAHRLVDAAKATGSEFVKFQAYRPAELLELRGDGPAPEPWGSTGYTMRTLYERAQTPLEWLPELFQHARDIGIVPFSSVFGLESLLVLERCACPAYKIARLDNTNAPLRDAVLSRNKPMLVSAESRVMIGGFNRDDVATLYCAPGYPTPYDKVRLPDFCLWGSDKFGGQMIGLSSHCLDPLLPIAAVSRGAKLVEMHMMLDDEPSELESEVSLTASAFRRMVDDVRRVEAMLA